MPLSKEDLEAIFDDQFKADLCQAIHNGIRNALAEEPWVREAITTGVKKGVHLAMPDHEPILDAIADGISGSAPTPGDVLGAIHSGVKESGIST